MEYISQLNNFFELSEDFGLEANDQLFYLHLLNMFNRSYWQEELRCTDAVLMRKAKIGSTRTIAKVKNRLMQTGFIEFHKGKNNITVYSLTELLCHKCKAECKARCKTKCKVCCKVEGKAPLIKFTPNIANQEDQIPLKQKTPLSSSARAHAREGGAGAAEIAKPTPEVKVEQKPVAEVSHSVRHRWIQATYSNPTELDEEGLAALEKEFGSEKVFWAIGEANRRKDRDRINLAFVEHILRNGDKPQKPKGEVRNEARQNNRPATEEGDRFSYRSQYDDL